MHKKNRKHLLSIIHAASHMLTLSEDYMNNKTPTQVDKKFIKDFSNQSLSYLKQEVKKLKRI